jgi:hypothetical protein
VLSFCREPGQLGRAQAENDCFFTQARLFGLRVIPLGAKPR